MSPKKTILRELSRASEQAGGGPVYRRPSTIPGFADEPERYQKAVNELLSERLLEGRKDEEGKMSITLNVHRLTDVRREIRPIWARPVVWAAIAIVVVIGAGLAVV